MKASLAVTLLLAGSAQAWNQHKIAGLLRDLGAVYPETKVLEHKVNKLKELEPAIDNHIEALDKLTKMPKVTEHSSTGELTKVLKEATKKKTVKKEKKEKSDDCESSSSESEEEEKPKKKAAHKKKKEAP